MLEAQHAEEKKQLKELEEKLGVSTYVFTLNKHSPRH